MVPAYYLDGQWALLSIIDIVFTKAPYKSKKLLADGIMIFSSFLFLLMIIVSLYYIS